MLGLSQTALAEMAGLSKTGVVNIEAGRADAKASTLRRLREALEAAGATFIPENGGGAGVRLTERRRRK